MGRKWLLLALMLSLAIAAGTACNARLVGSGDLVTETRQVSGFDRISLSGLGEVMVTQDGSESLTIETDNNIMEHLEIEVRGGTLQIGFKSGLRAILPSQLIFRVSVDDLTGLSISGSGDIEADDIETNRLEAEVSGAGDIHISNLRANRVEAHISGTGEIDLAGEATTQDVSISGAGGYLAGDLCSETVKVTVSGAGDATVCATGTLDTDISGIGSVNYYGRPSVSSSGGGLGKTNSLGDK